MKTKIKEIGSVIGACGLLLIITLGCGGTTVNITARSEPLPGTNKAIVSCNGDSYYCVKLMYQQCAKLNGEPEIFSKGDSQQINGRSYYYNGQGGSRISSSNSYWMIYNCKLNK